MTRLEALKVVERDLQNLEIRSTRTNIRLIGEIGGIVEALVDLEEREAAEKPEENPETEEE